MSHWLTLTSDTTEMYAVCRCGATADLGSEVQEPEKYLAKVLEWHRADVLLEELRSATLDHAAALAEWAGSGKPAVDLAMVDDRPWIAAMRAVGLITDESMVQP